jgi:hypothetical protein
VNITCAEGVIENQKEYMQPIVNIDDIEMALESDNSNSQFNILFYLLIVINLY